MQMLSATLIRMKHEFSNAAVFRATIMYAYIMRKYD